MFVFIAAALLFHDPIRELLEDFRKYRINGVAKVHIFFGGEIDHDRRLVVIGDHPRWLAVLQGFDTEFHRASVRRIKGHHKMCRSV